VRQSSIQDKPVLWKSRIESELPVWQDYFETIGQLPDHHFPTCNDLNALLPRGLTSHSDQAIRFCSSNTLPNDDYEQRIYSTGQVSTRAENWHDLFNALVWMRFPRIKSAMNALHYRARPENKTGTRGAQRDALTLFDECGAIVFSDQPELLNALFAHRWKQAFQVGGNDHDGNSRCSGLQVIIPGHAMLEKYLSPYKAMTAKALLVEVDPPFMKLRRNQQVDFLDDKISRQMMAGTVMSSPGDLTPLPVAGIPGWWPWDDQKQEFYNNTHVFRAPKNVNSGNCL